MEGTLDPMLLLALKDMSFEYMTPVQSKVLGNLPSLQSDCLVQAKTGTSLRSIDFYSAPIDESAHKCREHANLDYVVPLREPIMHRSC